MGVLSWAVVFPEESSVSQGEEGWEVLPISFSSPTARCSSRGLDGAPTSSPAAPSLRVGCVDCCCPLDIGFRGYHGDPHTVGRRTRLGRTKCVCSLGCGSKRKARGFWRVLGSMARSHRGGFCRDILDVVCCPASGPRSSPGEASVGGRAKS